MTDQTKTPDRIWVCGGGYKQSEYLSAVSTPDTYPHKTEYVRADVARPVTKDEAQEALDEFERLVKFAEANGHVSKHDKAIIETIRALLEAAAQQGDDQ